MDRKGYLAKCMHLKERDSKQDEINCQNSKQLLPLGIKGGPANFECHEPKVLADSVPNLLIWVWRQADNAAPPRFVVRSRSEVFALNICGYFPNPPEKKAIMKDR